jgi:hypothetical protein
MTGEWPKPGSWTPLVRHPVERWKGGLKEAFGLFAPQAVYVAAPERPVSVALLEPRWKPASRPGSNIGAWSVRIAKDGWKGGNPFLWQRVGTDEDREDYLGPKGCLPVEIGLTGWQQDKVTARLPKDPYVPWAVRRRFWTLGLEDGDDAFKLRDMATQMLRSARESVRTEEGGETLPWGYIDAGWRFSADYFEAECVIPAARRLGLWVRSEEGLAQFLERAMARSVRQHGPYSQAGHDAFHDLCLEMIEEERGRGQARHALAPKPITILGEALKPAHRRMPAASPHSMQVKQAAYGEEIARQIEEKRREKGLAR